MKTKKQHKATASPLMSEYAPQYLEVMEHILSPTTYQFYKRNITENILPFFGSTALEDITPLQVQQYISYLLKKRAKTRGVVDQDQGGLYHLRQ